MGKALAAAGLCAALWNTAVFAGPAQPQPDFAGVRVSEDMRFAVQWSMKTNDHQGLPFAVVDKRGARLLVFTAAGKLAGQTPVLLGQSNGDKSAPDVGEHTQAGFVPIEERTTPAGRFLTEPGVNTSGEHVVWVDYDAAFAIHRLRPAANLREREAALASATPDDNRSTLGCVVVPVAFYKKIVEPVIGRSRAVVYVLPEQGSVQEMLSGASL
jgi:hypothetical protein